MIYCIYPSNNYGSEGIVDLSNYAEVLALAEELGKTPEEIVKAIFDYGCSVRKIKRALH